jgi:hypothetical protein
MKTSLLILSVLCSAAVAAETTWTRNWNVSAVIPDNDPVGYVNHQTFDGIDLTDIVSVGVMLHFEGGWNGDLYAYLVHNTGFSVLLNRPGRTAADPDGSASLGLNVWLREDSAFSDIHTAIPMSGGPVTGTYRPDGRATSPATVLDTDSRTATLSSFTGLNPNGTWSLFVADTSPGETATLQSWSLEIVAVPEPTAGLLGGFSLAMLLLVRRRRSAPGTP